MKGKPVKPKEPEKRPMVNLDFKNPGKFKKPSFQAPTRFTNVRSFGGHH